MTRVEEIKSKKSVSLFIMLIRWTNEATRRYLKVRQCRVFGTQATEGCNFEESSPAQPKERRSWSPTEDVVLISSWLNTSKDPVVGNEQRSVAFWKRIATYFNASPKLVGCEKRESSQCKQRWHKINDMFDQIFDQTFENLMIHGDEEDARKKRKKRAFIERNREEGHVRLWNDYFSETPTYPENFFRRRFRMNKPLFMRIVDRLSNEVPYFRQKKDALGRLGLSSLQKCTTAIRVLAYGIAADTVDEYLRLGETTTRKCLEHFVEGIINLFSDEYLRRPTLADLQRLLYIGEYRGFPGMIGSIDCMHWEWKNCPTAWKGQYSRGSGKPTIVLEAVASYDLWIWHAFFGPPGTLNDINVLDRSPVFDDIIKGHAPAVTYYVNGREYHLAYYLTDGIYPKWATFIQSIPLPQGPKAVLFAQHQEAVRKDVERAFGVLQSRFVIAKNPSLFWDKIKIGRIMRACIILHNMIVEDERDGYSLFNVSEFQQGEDNGSSHVDLMYSTDIPTNIANMMNVRTRIRDRQMHQQLKDDLVEHVWLKFGREDDNN
uniref:Myb-like domain-containing protein n=1 Tax=Brassica oleracea var. oleracea TaxID=109376 RepID=A0A0D3ACM1_BRAOL